MYGSFSYGSSEYGSKILAQVSTLTFSVSDTVNETDVLINLQVDLVDLFTSEIDATLDYPTIVITTYFISVNDSELEEESTTIRVSIIRSISVFDSETDNDVVSLVVPLLFIFVTDAEVESEFVLINLPQLLGEFTLQLSFTLNPYLLQGSYECI
jgi:hypothetical protein